MTHINKHIFFVFSMVLLMDFCFPQLVYGNIHVPDSVPQVDTTMQTVKNTEFATIEIGFQEAMQDTVHHWTEEELEGKSKKELLQIALGLQKERDLLDEKVRQLESDTLTIRTELNNCETREIYNNFLIDDLQDTLSHKIALEVVNAFGKECKNAGIAFCAFLLESPFYQAYNDTLVAQSLERANLLGYTKLIKPNKAKGLSGNLDYYETYQIYKPLLENYGKYTQEIANAIDKVITDFVLERDKIDRSREKERFMASINSSEYYKVKGTGKYPNERRIIFLDYRIYKVLELFEKDSSFKVEKFKEEHRKVLGEK